MTDTTKKAWFKPELIVLVRGKPEERVLTECKSFYEAQGIGSGSGNFYCE